jgi:hypothetical protein
MTAVVIVEGLVIVLLAVLVAGLLRSHAEILRRLHALGAGEDVDRVAPVAMGPSRRPTALSDAPVRDVTGVTPDGKTLSVALADSRGYTLLAFLSSGCTTCKTFWAQFAESPDIARTDVRPVIVTRSAVDESLSDVRKLAPTRPPTVMSSDAWDAFRVPYTPYFALIDGSRGAIVGDGAAAGWPQLLDLVERALGDAAASHEHDEGPPGGGGGPARRRGTAGRLADTDEELRRAGIQPGDPVLHQRPVHQPGER